MKTKICRKCKIEKPAELFYKNKKRKDGLSSYCIDCQLKACKQCVSNKVHVEEKECNGCHKVKKANEYYSDVSKKDGLGTMCKECTNRKNHKWKMENLEKYTECGYKYRMKTKDKKRKYDSVYLQKRINGDEYYKHVRRICSCIRGIVIKKSKGSKYEKYLGCSIEFFRKHIESLFQEGMSWRNYGDHRNDGWSIDHIIPVSKFNLNNEEELYKCFNYKNTQPLWWWQNQIKFSKVLNEKELGDIRNTNKVICEK